MKDVLQISVSLLFFVNKSLLLVNKRSGWLFGAFAAILAIFYFFSVGLYVYTTLEFGLIVLMVFGFLKEKSKNIDNLVRIFTLVIMIVIGCITFKGSLTFFELTSSISLLLGMYLLAKQYYTWGWFASIIAHGSACYIGYCMKQDFFANFQLASAFIACIGVYQSKTID